MNTSRCTNMLMLGKAALIIFMGTVSICTLAVSSARADWETTGIDVEVTPGAGGHTYAENGGQAVVETADGSQEYGAIAQTDAYLHNATGYNTSESDVRVQVNYHFDNYATDGVATQLNQFGAYVWYQSTGHATATGTAREGEYNDATAMANVATSDNSDLGAGDTASYYAPDGSGQNGGSFDHPSNFYFTNVQRNYGSATADYSVAAWALTEGEVDSPDVCSYEGYSYAAGHMSNPLNT